jgi:hypothetical protein
LEEIATANPREGLIGCLLVRLECEGSNYTAARARLELLARDDWAALDRDVDWLLAVAVLAESTAILDDEKRAAQLYDLLAPHASLVALAPHAFPIGVVSRYLGLLAAVLSCVDEAVHWLEDAAARNAAIDAHIWAAHAKADHARVLLARQAPGDGEQARKLLLEALPAYQKHALSASAEMVAALLTEVASPPPAT